MLKLKFQYFGHLMWEADSLEKTLLLREIEAGGEENNMVAWEHRLDGQEIEQAPGFGNGQGSLEYWSPWGRKESDMT